MSSHALYTALDRDRIASQSEPVLADLLRGELGFEGVVVTDSIEAQAVLARSGVAEAAERSCEAGADLDADDRLGELERGAAPAAAPGAARPRLPAPACASAPGRVLALKRRLGLARP